MSNTVFPRREGPWEIHDEAMAFDNPWLSLKTYGVTLPNTGAPGEYGVVRFKNLAIGVLPLDEGGNTWIVGQHRFPLNQYSWELPEGGGPKDEAPEATAARELEEECGLIAQNFLPLGHWHTSNSVTDEEAFAFIATGLAPGKVAPDPSEVLEVRQLPFAELLNLVISGNITDAFTVMMVQTAYIKASRGLLPAEISAVLLK
jgi:8-oxo-dGTP pyrophosphatase MutT (NUDIX family)